MAAGAEAVAAAAAAAEAEAVAAEAEAVAAAAVAAAAGNNEANLRFSPGSVRRRIGRPGNTVVDVDTDTAQTLWEWITAADNATYERGTFYNGLEGTPVDAMTNGAGPAHIASATPSPSTSDVARIGQQLLDQEQQQQERQQQPLRRIWRGDDDEWATLVQIE